MMGSWKDRDEILARLCWELGKILLGSWQDYNGILTDYNGILARLQWYLGKITMGS